MSSNDDQQHANPNSEVQKRLEQINNSNTQPKSNREMLTAKNNTKKRQSKLSFKDKGPIIAAIITGIFSLVVAFITVWLPLKAQIDDRDEKISNLNLQRSEQDRQINDLKIQLGKKDEIIAGLSDQINDLKNPLPRTLSQKGNVQFEWQWAGENWYGRVTLQKRGNDYLVTQTKVGLLEKNIEDRFLINGQVLNLVPNSPGTFEMIEGGIRIEIPVMKKDRRTGELKLTTLKGTLQQTLCYAVRIGYLDSGGLYQGDIVLVDLAYAPIYASQLDDWFLNEQEWFEEYYIDRDASK